MSDEPDVVDFELKFFVAKFRADTEQVGQNFARECWQVVNLQKNNLKKVKHRGGCYKDPFLFYLGSSSLGPMK